MKVLDALQAINEKYDADISFRSSCRAGQCGSCGILFKGNGALACQKEIKDGAIIEPLNFPVIKDLIVDKSSIEAKVKDFLINELEIEEDVIFPEAKLKEDMGIDSLDFVDIVVIVEKNFGFKIKAEEMVGVDTYTKFCDYIESKIS